MALLRNFKNQIKYLDKDYRLLLDNTSETESKQISYSNLVVDLKYKLDNINIIPSANIKFNPTTQILEIFNDVDLVPVRKDGLILAFKLPKGLPLLPFNLKVATNPNYTTSTFGMQVYNGYYYDNYGYTGLDQGSLSTIGLNYLVWDSTLARWKLYKQSIKSSKLLQFNMKASDVTANQDPNVGFVFWNTDVPFDTTAYPVLSRAFNGGVIPRQDNATLAGQGSDTPINVTSEGQIDTINKKTLSKFKGLVNSVNGSFSLSEKGDVYSQRSPNGITPGTVNTTMRYSINKNYQTTINFNNYGNETLTRRFGITMAIGL